MFSYHLFLSYAQDISSTIQSGEAAFSEIRSLTSQSMLNLMMLSRVVIQWSFNV